MSEGLDKQSQEQPDDKKEDISNSQETNESFLAAQEKLKRLLDENFKDYAIRFANIGEYEEIMATKSIGGKECIVLSQKEKPEDISFKDWVGSGHWGNKMDETNWAEHSGSSYVLYHRFLWYLRNAYREAVKESKSDTNNETSIRDRTIENFIKEIEPEKGSIFGFFKDATIIQHAREYLQRVGSGSKKKELEDQLKEVDHSKLEFIEKIQDTPELLKDEDNLRKLFSILPYLADETARMEGRESAIHRENQYQYEIVLVIDPSVVSNSKSWSQPHWKYIKGGKMEGDELLGVVVITPDRKMVERVTELSSRSGNLSHPVFTDKGVVAYPKQ